MLVIHKTLTVTRRWGRRERGHVLLADALEPPTEHDREERRRNRQAWKRHYLRAARAAKTTAAAEIYRAQAARLEEETDDA